MAVTVVWTKRAASQLEELIVYLEQNASQKAVSSFIQKLSEKLDLLGRYPDIGRKSSKKPGIQMYKLDKTRNLYYRIQKDNLIIIFLFDTRQNPSRNPYWFL